MGMAASQARLLSLTCRMTDIEGKAQNIQAQKITLATQKDEVYERYCAALDATKIQVAFYNDDKSQYMIDANFDTVCNYSENRYGTYMLQDNRSGLAIVSSKVETNYNEYANDKYAFAWAMLGHEQFDYANHGDMRCSAICVGYFNNSQLNQVAEDDLLYEEIPDDFRDGNALFMTPAELAVYNDVVGADDGVLKAKLEAIKEGETTAEKQKALTEFRDYFYSKYANQLFDAHNVNRQDGTAENGEETLYFDREWQDISQEFNYYLNLWEFINDCGGCQVIEPQYEKGEEGCTWFNNSVEAGLVSIHEYNNNSDTWKETSVATSTNKGYLKEVQDEKDLKKAEAEYEHELEIINRKDKKFDTELSKLETERSAIDKQMQSIKEVIKKNSETAFGIFS